MPFLNKELLSKIFPKYIPLFEQINNNVFFKNLISQNSKNCISLPRKTKHDYFQSINDEILKNESIDYLEFGVYEGNTILDWSEINKNPNSRFFGFDKFPSKYPIPETDDKRITFVKGLFHETLNNFIKDFTPNSRIVIFINLNKYPEALFCLTQLDTILSHGSLVMFDQFGNLQGEFLAFYNYIKSYKRNFSFICQTENWRKATVELHERKSMVKPSEKLKNLKIDDTSNITVGKKKANVIFLLIDDFRADKCYGSKRTSITPNLELLIENGVYFDQAISSADGTFASMGSIFTSQYPFKTGITWAQNHSKAKKHFENLKIYGYNVYVTAPNYNFFETITKNYPEKNITIHDPQMGLFDGVGDLIIKRLQSMKMQKPWFYYIHVMDLHLQRITSDKFNQPEYGKTEYERKVSSVDYWIGKIVEEVNFDDTMIIIASDHGEYVLDNMMRPDYIPGIQKGLRNAKKFTPKFMESIGLKGFVLLRSILTPMRKAQFKKTLNPSKLRSTFKRGKDYLYDEAIHIPLIFVGAGINQHKIISDQVRHVDIFPTISEMIGIPINKKSSNGRSLLPLMNDELLDELPALIESMPVLDKPVGDVIGVRTSNFKYFRSRSNPKEKVTLFDLKNDPTELNNIAELKLDIVNTMEKILSNEIQDTMEKNSVEELTEEKKLKAMQVLREMGYD